MHQRVVAVGLDPEPACDLGGQFVVIEHQRTDASPPHRRISQQGKQRVGLVFGTQLAVGEHRERSLGSVGPQAMPGQPVLGAPLKAGLIGERCAAMQEHVHSEARLVRVTEQEAAHACTSAGLAGCGAAAPLTPDALVVAKRVASSRSMADPSCLVRLGT